MNTDNLIEFRKLLELTQTEMGELLGVKTSAYAKYENLKTIIPLEKLNIISNKYNLSLDYLAGVTRINNTDFKHIDIDKVKIGKRLKEGRIKLKLTQEEIAKKLHSNRTSISQYEKGKGITIIVLIQYSELFNQSIDYLCGKAEK